MTIARWYYTARRVRDDPVGALRRAVRKDCGKVSLAAALAEQLHFQYRDHPHWSYQLHYDNLAALVKADPSLGRLPSYSTVKRFMQAHGWARRPKLRPSGRPGEVVAEKRRTTREVRSYEATHVGALWHLDFHHGSLKVLTARRPVAAPDRAGHPRRPLATVLPRPVVSLGDRRRPGAWTLPGDPETGSATCPLDRQRLGDGGRGSHRRTLAAGHRPRADAAVQPLSKR